MTKSIAKLTAVAEVKNALQESHGPGLAVQTYAQLVRSSLDMKVNDLENIKTFTDELGEAGTKVATEGLAALKKINTHLTTAREHAQTWNDKILPELIQTNEDVRGYSREFSVLGDAALRKLRDAKDKPEDVMKAALSDASGKLQALSDAIDQRAKHVQDLSTPLAAFQKGLQEDAKAFTEDKTTVEAALTGDQSWLNNVSKEIDALHDGIAKDNWEIAGGSLMIAAGVVTGVVGGILIATGVGAPVGLAVIGVGVCVAGGGTALVTVAGIDLHKKQQELADNQRRLTLLKACVSSFKTSESAVTKLSSAATAAATGAEDLYKAWVSLGSQLKETVEMIGDAIQAGGGKLKDALDTVALMFQAAVTEWNTALDTSKNIATALSGLKSDPKKDIKEVHQDLGLAA
ncbi:HBL/NHE enterotoxin family protein [Streptomyces sp. DT24]|uniref:HBL/NHE enterotoxin family protein n=1 Tax=Streptomyces sp. DT24 TaxID=3416520 RepID=UPI003CE6EE31